jgi:hypothetical protein
MWPVGSSPAIHSWINLPVTAQSIPSAVTPPEVSSRFATSSGAKRAHSFTACALGSQSGAGGTSDNSGSLTAPSASSRSGRIVPETTFNDRGLRPGPGICENLVVHLDCGNKSLPAPVRNERVQRSDPPPTQVNGIAILTPRPRLGIAFLDRLLVAVVAFRAQRLPVRGIPKQVIVTTVRHDVVDYLGRTHQTLRHAHGAQWVHAQVRHPCLIPLVGVPPISSAAPFSHRIPLLNCAQQKARTRAGSEVQAVVLVDTLAAVGKA